ncbi:hypothetical protein OPV22_020872 [Ensete ventricosum]|uniref:Uncharacterized protein n=1 Tax=Ensete ventricosum TaxID=4639 RepID=A0AAV8QP18_ENSVE|nr:hypothetical protein OPV22_020872 [Ensete ventricosum]
MNVRRRDDLHSSFLRTSCRADSLLLLPEEAFPWLSPRISFGHDPTPVAPPEGRPDGHAEDFEFRRHDDPVTMLPADELFSGCKLVPFQLAAPESEIARSKPPETDRKPPPLPRILSLGRISSICCTAVTSPLLRKRP